MVSRGVHLLAALALACASPDFAARPDRTDPDAAATAAYERACEVHTIVGYKRFLEQHPRAPEVADARSRLEALRFNAAKSRGTAAGLRQFLREHPDGANAEAARALLAEAERREVAEDPAAALAQRPAAPATVTGERAAERLDDVAYAQAVEGGPWGLFRYLREQPAGAHRVAAQAELWSWELESLLFSGRILQAREEAARSPLSAHVADLEARFDRAEREVAALRAEAVQQAFAANYLRSVEDLSRALTAPDPLDRWQAAEELGQHVTTAALDPLLQAVRGGRNALIAHRALQSLLRLARALPPKLAQYELARRVEALRSAGDGREASLGRAVLLDAAGRLEEAAAEYQRAYDPRDPDPLVLRRWIAIRQERDQAFSSAVAARQLAVWAHAVAQAHDPAAPGASPLWTARALCAAAEGAHTAEEAILAAQQRPTEFPEDLQAFLGTARAARRLTDARLADAELALRRADPNALGCADRRVAERLEDAARLRAQALEALPSKAPRLAPLLLRLASERDPSDVVRTRARALLAGLSRR